MKKRIRKNFKFLAILVLTFSILMACSNNSTKTDANKSSDSAGNSKKPVTLTIFVDQTFWPLKDWTGKIPEEITKETGVKLKVQVATDAQQLPLMISSGDLPDLVFTTNNFQQMSNSNISYTWDELIKKYNISNFNIDPMARVLNQASDGNLYSIKNGFTNPQTFQDTPKALGNVPAISLRQDILDKLGDPKINSLDDLVNVLKEVKQKYPNMTPLVMNPGAIGQYFRVNYGVPYQGFETINGKVKYYIDDPKQYDYYMFMNELYRDGLIQAENFTWTDTNKAKDMIENGQAFAINNVTATDAINTELKSNGKNYKIVQLTKLLGSSPKIYGNATGWSGLFITKNCKDPEAAIKFLQFMHSQKGQQLGLWGVKGQDYTMDKTVANGGYPKFNYNSQDTTVQQKMGVVWWGLLADDGINEQVQRYVPNSDQTAAEVDAKQYVDSDPLLGAVTPPSGSDEQAIQANIDNMIKNEQTKIYLAKTPAQAKQAYQNMMKTADQIGLQKLDKYANDQYKKVKQEYNKVK
ncbi:ABC transporter substrate-binding protein [Pullulanibacillus sp. KACC 23026]|uniref:extracellular solute-binding protein n=1 Tax=Pullulanibacillus sp. KACC 23026 TaxID=3028315 RepID=UPI0023B084B6|nr:extracellular solute-binding protein [Pullulanibacillus sp. KACC 23026]WEG11742.1 ABC transporter substrate-binding protein [Pullulanibacillus sp. KACC 23026]